MPSQADYSELLSLQTAAHALDRINQAFRDNEMNDAELAVFVGERLRECGYTLPQDDVALRGWETFPLPFGQPGRVHYGSHFYSAERRHDGVVIYHTGARWMRASRTLTQSFESNTSMTR
jgi:hypothetical protein